MWIHLLPLGLIDGAGASVAPVPPPLPQGGGGGRRRKPRIVRFSDFETREALERELLAAIPFVPAPATPEPIPFDDDEDDDEVVLQLLMMMH